MKLNVNAPIHAATAMLTATVTAMRMIEATTGLRAFLLLVIFILFLSLLFGVTTHLEEDEDLNLATYYTRLLVV
jgi:ABC-type transport system involved in cytochrome bd biosynthesis fused ATPase/permease subunit